MDTHASHYAENYLCEILGKYFNGNMNYWFLTPDHPRDGMFVDDFPAAPCPPTTRRTTALWTPLGGRATSTVWEASFPRQRCHLHQFFFFVSCVLLLFSTVILFPRTIYLTFTQIQAKALRPKPM